MAFRSVSEAETWRVKLRPLHFIVAVSSGCKNLYRFYFQKVTSCKSGKGLHSSIQVHLLLLEDLHARLER